MTSNHHALYDLGYTRTTMDVNRGKQDSDVEQTPKNILSSDCRLQPVIRLSRLLHCLQRLEQLLKSLSIM